jgi:hypothetical protein
MDPRQTRMNEGDPVNPDDGIMNPKNTDETMDPRHRRMNKEEDPVINPDDEIMDPRLIRMDVEDEPDMNPDNGLMDPMTFRMNKEDPVTPGDEIMDPRQIRMNEEDTDLMSPEDNMKNRDLFAEHLFRVRKRNFMMNPALMMNPAFKDGHKRMVTNNMFSLRLNNDKEVCT